MRPELETYQLIDKFLNGELGGDELLSFEQKLQSDPSFAEEVSFQKLTNEVVVGASFDSLRSQMTKDISNIDSSNNNQKWGLASIAFGVISIGMVALYSSSKQSDSTISSKTTTPSSVLIQKESQQNNPVLSNKTEEKTVQTITPSIKNNTTAGGNTEISTPQESVIKSATTQHTENIQSTESTDIHKSTQPNTEKIVASDPCLQTSITAKIISNPSCSDAANGSVKIPLNEIKGGIKPYAISFNQSKASASKELYAYLKADTYTVSISDANGCIKEYTVDVEEKNCRKKSFIFAPDKGEIWSIEGVNNDPYVMTILNMSGRQIFKTNTMQGIFEWQGVSQQGEYLDAGLYIYIIEYTNGTKENGQVTIVR